MPGRLVCWPTSSTYTHTYTHTPTQCPLHAHKPPAQCLHQKHYGAHGWYCAVRTSVQTYPSCSVAHTHLLYMLSDNGLACINKLCELQLLAKLQDFQRPHYVCCAVSRVLQRGQNGLYKPLLDRADCVLVREAQEADALDLQTRVKHRRAEPVPVMQATHHCGAREFARRPSPWCSGACILNPACACMRVPCAPILGAWCSLAWRA